MLDFSPLFQTAIGFDRMVGLMDSVQEAATPPAYPPYNIAKTSEDTYRLSLAVAGFSQDNLDLIVKDNQLIVTGRVTDDAVPELLYRGIVDRAFERRFALADYIVVEGADLKNGLLHVTLKRVVPEALKPRRIAIGAAQARATIANDSGKVAQAA